MKIISIEPTPSPHSMKINIDDTLPEGENKNFQHGDDLSHAPNYIKDLFAIEGVKGLYQVQDFITLQRNPRIQWEPILSEVRQVLGSAEATESLFRADTPAGDDHFGEVQVFIQMFRHIPMQVKLQDGESEERFGLPDYFTTAVMQASEASENMLVERKWVEQRPRYGNMQEIGTDLVEEITATYDETRVTALVQTALASKAETPPEPRTGIKVTLDMLDDPDWKARYAALDRMDPMIDDLAVLDKALDDDKASVRRLATAFLGMIEEPEVLPYLYKALQDKAVNVRRTAGDCLSDLGFKEAMPDMIKTLDDSSRIVRWRAAMFLYEIGDETAVPALQKALNDPEFEVRMQVKMALARIEDGQEAQGSIWHQMTQATQQK